MPARKRPRRHCGGCWMRSCVCVVCVGEARLSESVTRSRPRARDVYVCTCARAARAHVQLCASVRARVQACARARSRASQRARPGRPPASGQTGPGPRRCRPAQPAGPRRRALRDSAHPRTTRTASARTTRTAPLGPARPGEAGPAAGSTAPFPGGPARPGAPDWHRHGLTRRPRVSRTRLKPPLRQRRGSMRVRVGGDRCRRAGAGRRCLGSVPPCGGPQRPSESRRADVALNPAPCGQGHGGMV